ncbi:hypothetical protein KKH23_02355 [Patescibacteria group bacterium]|nr:hypothetical protein [Patescibacteria group bacterium]MBU0846018.1 hypothetical protein [Patescibacteria group bacterium]MBU1066785.1 hypothetical protein [Patescibacteria group bacterium]
MGKKLVMAMLVVILLTAAVASAAFAGGGPGEPNWTEQSRQCSEIGDGPPFTRGPEASCRNRMIELDPNANTPYKFGN